MFYELMTLFTVPLVAHNRVHHLADNLHIVIKLHANSGKTARL